MNNGPVSIRTKVLLDSVSALSWFFEESSWTRRLDDTEACDFTLGNPHEVALPTYVKTLQEQVIPRDEHWYAYKRNEPGPRSIIANSLRKSHELAFNVFCLPGSLMEIPGYFRISLTASDEMVKRAIPVFAAVLAFALDTTDRT